jgi:hypothetical protein
MLTTDNWISFATCHFDAGMDKRTWLGFPDGPRNTPALFGVGDTLPIHWSADLDELQDVELTVRAIQFGQGLISGDAHDSLGPTHAELSQELAALAAYMDSLEVPHSPLAQDGQAIVQGLYFHISGLPDPPCPAALYGYSVARRGNRGFHEGKELPWTRNEL